MPLEISRKHLILRRLSVGTVNGRELLVNCSKTGRGVSAGGRGALHHGFRCELRTGGPASIRFPIRAPYLCGPAIAAQMSARLNDAGSGRVPMSPQRGDLMARAGREEHSRDCVAFSRAHRDEGVDRRGKRYKGRVETSVRGERAGREDGVGGMSTREFALAFNVFSSSEHRRCASSYSVFHHNAEARRSSLSCRKVAFCWRRVDSSSRATCCDPT